MHTTQIQFSIPTLNEGETYAGAIFSPDGQGHHVILLPGDQSPLTWQKVIDWAKSIDGDLPSRLELSLLYTHSREHFEKDWYWSNETCDWDSAYAWYQSFGYGDQIFSRKDYGLCRARAVRRLPI